MYEFAPHTLYKSSDYLSRTSQSPSIYMSLPYVSVANGYSQGGKTFTDVTALAASSTLSIIRSDDQKPGFELEEIACSQFEDLDLVFAHLKTQFLNADSLRDLDPVINNCNSGFEIFGSPHISLVPLTNALIPLTTALIASPRGPGCHPPLAHRKAHRKGCRKLDANES